MNRNIYIYVYIILISWQKNNRKLLESVNSFNNVLYYLLQLRYWYNADVFIQWRETKRKIVSCGQVRDRLRFRVLC